MKILELIHGYPPQYNAGSENYTEAISNEFVKKGHEVYIFCREENHFGKEYSLSKTTDNKEPKIKKYLINVARGKDRFVHERIDVAFAEVLDEIMPDVVHIEHLNHLSLGIPKIIKERKIPMVYTLHDFWLMCPRGQFLEYNMEGEPWNVCDGQEDQKCASVCYARYHTGTEHMPSDKEYWVSWVNTRMRITRECVNLIDQFISPSKTVMTQFERYFPENAGKLIFLDYGFDLNKLSKENNVAVGNKMIFGYIGTHIPAKGIDYLIRAFSKLKGEATLRIWGRNRGEYTPYLKNLDVQLLSSLSNRIEWMGEFETEKIVNQVFEHVDAIVVPSIWMENSPLVIHEAQQAGIPVITADFGGMKEYVQDGVNGFLFKFRDVDSMASRMQEAVDHPEKIKELGKRRYLYSKTGDVPSISDHVDSLLQIFSKLKPKS